MPCTRENAAQPVQPQPTYKELLDKKAFEVRNPDAGKEVEPSLVEKGTARDPWVASVVGNPCTQFSLAVAETVTDYIPAAAKILGTETKEEREERERKVAAERQAVEVGGPPERPHHDEQIEEFLKEQHKSMKGQNGKLNF